MPDMDIPIIQTKVALPSRKKELLSRQRLLDLLYEQLDYRLVILTAPAGYGKTSLLVDFAHLDELPICWYSLDPLDQDLYRFAAHLAASLAVPFQELRKWNTSILKSAIEQNLPAEQLAALLAKEVDDHIGEHIAIVLDDYHLVDASDAVNTFTSSFLQMMGENCHVIIASRTTLPLPDLTLMVARGQVSGLGFHDLAFSSNEIQELMFQNYNMVLPTPEAEELAQETEGWITGLLLSAQTMYQGMVDRLRAARVSGVDLYEFLAKQVLDQQPTHLRDFLLQTSLFDEFNANLCEAVLGEPPEPESWQSLVAAALQANLFLLPVDEKGGWVRYHHLFQSFLQNRLVQEHPDQETRILRRLAETSAADQEWEKAHALYVRLGDRQALADLIEEAGSPLVERSRMALLAEWIDALPPETFQARPALQAQRGIAAAVMGDSSQGLALLDRATEAFRERGERPRLAGALLWRSYVHSMQGSYQAVLDDTGEVIALAQRPFNGKPEAAPPPEMARYKAEGLRLNGHCLMLMGRLKQAIQILSEALSSFQLLGDKRSAARVSLSLGAACLDVGEYGRALAYYQPVLEFYRAEKDIFALPSVLSDLGFLYYLRGDYSQASKLLSEALALSRQSGNSHAEALALASLGDLYADLGETQAAKKAYEQSAGTAWLGRDNFTVGYLEVARAAMARRQNDLEEAHRLLGAAGQTAQRSSSGYIQGLYQAEAGRLALAENDPLRALDLLEHAAAAFDQGGQRLEAGRARLSAANAAYKTGDEKTAHDLLGQAFDLVSGIDSRHALVTAGREAKELLREAAKSPKTQRQAAQLLEQIERFESGAIALRRKLRRNDLAIPLSPPKIHIQALGRTQVVLDERPVTSADWQVHSSRELFFLVLSHPKGLAKETLGDLLWPDSSPGQLKLRFKNNLYRLRHALGQEAVVFEDERYRFNRAIDYEYDVELFLEKIEQAGCVTDLARRAQLLDEAIALYEGPYLLEISSTWVLVERERLHQAFVEAGLELAELRLQSGEIKTALQTCQRLLAEDSCLEEAHRLAMRAYVALGDRGAAARQFERCRQALWEELGLEPSQETEDLFQKITR